VEREGRAIALLPGLQVRQQSADVGEEEITVESACWKEIRALREAASAARHWETNTESVDDTHHQRLHVSVYTQVCSWRCIPD
jgi:hypothetical protein